MDERFEGKFSVNSKLTIKLKVFSPVFSYATVIYYLHNKQEIDEYLTNWLEWGHKMREEQKHNPPPIFKKLRQLRAERLISGKSYANQVFDG